MSSVASEEVETSNQGREDVEMELECTLSELIVVCSRMRFYMLQSSTSGHVVWMHLRASWQVDLSRTLKRPVVYLGRVTHVLHLALEDQTISGRDWTDDRSVLSGRARVRLKLTSKAVVVA